MTTPPMTTDAEATEARTAPDPIKAAPGRLTSIDAYRGFVMFLMVAEAFHLGRVSRMIPESGFWKFLASQQDHRAWVGCSLHDLIQPSFTFLVGVALPFSIASRLAKGQSFGNMLGHAIWRSFLLIALGIFLRSTGSSQTNFTFEDTLTQIGLGYTFAFLIAFARPKAQWIGLAVILVGYWAAWALYPLPPANLDWKTVGVGPDWVHLTGFAQHWDKNWNLGTAFDRWFLNLFPRKNPFHYNGGGYLTLSFIPTLGTMLFGLMAGRWLRSERTSGQKVQTMLMAAAICFAVSAVLHFSGINPVVKRIWTPAWTIFSAGWCFVLLAVFYFVIDIKGYKTWAFPLVVIGMNSIAIYCLSHLIDGFILKTFQTHFGQDLFKVFGDAYSSLFSGAVLTVVLWLILYWMYRRQLFLRV
jgi:heparan-alpha-glucosaminide N-acetyltransferase